MDKSDSGASNNYWRTEDMSVLTNVKNTMDGTTVQLSNNETISATRTENILLARIISAHAKKAQNFHGLHSDSLISLYQLCDDDCIAIFDNNEFNIIKGRKLILKGPSNKTDGIWDITISIPVMYCVMSIVTKGKTKT